MIKCLTTALFMNVTTIMSTIFQKDLMWSEIDLPLFSEHLIRLLEALGTLSITATELTKFIKILKADVHGNQVSHT